MSTTKLTRKEISADPIHDALIQGIETVRSRAKLLGVIAAGMVVLALAIYFGLGYLDARDKASQQDLAKAMDFFHAQIDANAKGDPYAMGPMPTFANEKARYTAAAEAFAATASRYGSSKIGAMARYYLGLCQIQLGQKSEAMATLEAATKNTADRTVAYLAKKVLASYCVETGDAKRGQEILQGMLKDPQCDLPKEDLQVNLSRALMAQGKRSEALKVLQDAQDAGGGGMLQSLVFQEMNRIQNSSGN